MAQACELPRASDRSSSHAAIASDTSSATFANSAQSHTTSSNNCAITTPCATGNSGNPRRRHEYWSSRSPQSDWRAANSGNATTPQVLVWKFDHWTGVPYCDPSNQYEPNTPNSGCNTDVYARAPCPPQPPPVFNSYRQPQPYQHTPYPLFQQPRGLQTANGALPLDFHGIPPLVDTFAQPLPIADDRQQRLPQLSERRTYVSGAV